MVPPSERSSKSLRSVNTLDTYHHSAERTPSKDKQLVSGSAKKPTKELLEELINLLPPLPSLPKPPSPVSEESEKKLNSMHE
mgnify:CR=1 FL=1